MNTTKTFADKFLEKATFKSIYKIRSSDLDDLINEYFNNPKRRYQSDAYEEWSNHSTHSFAVEKEEVDVSDGFDGDWHYCSLCDILIHLCNEGIIPECELNVSVCW